MNQFENEKELNSDTIPKKKGNKLVKIVIVLVCVLLVIVLGLFFITIM